MTATDFMTGAKAVEMLQSVGYEIVKETDKIEIKKGARKLTLPKGEVLCNSTMARTVDGIVAEALNKNLRLGISKPNKTPLMVLYRNVGYAVLDDRHTKWFLSSLDDGRRFEALKSQCSEYEEEEMPTFSKVPVEEAPEAADIDTGAYVQSPIISPPVEVPMQTGYVVPEPTYSPMTNPTDKQALLRLTRRHVETLKVEREQLVNKLEIADAAMRAAAAFLASLGEETDLPPPVEGRRTVLPSVPAPGTSKRGRRPTTSPDILDKIRMAWIDSGRGTATEVKKRLGKMGVHVANSTLYNHVKKLRDAQ